MSIDPLKRAEATERAAKKAWDGASETHRRAELVLSKARAGQNQARRAYEASCRASDRLRPKGWMLFVHLKDGEVVERPRYSGRAVSIVTRSDEKITARLPGTRGRTHRTTFHLWPDGRWLNRLPRKGARPSEELLLPDDVDEPPSLEKLEAWREEYIAYHIAELHRLAMDGGRYSLSVEYTLLVEE